MKRYGNLTVSKINRVYDGDTFFCDIPWIHQLIGDNMKIRVMGIDTPEMRGGTEEEKKAAVVSKEFAEDILFKGERIELRNIGRGSFFRIIAEVWVDGVNLGDLLLENGLAVQYVKK